METGSKSVFPSGTTEYCYSTEVRQGDSEEMNSIFSYPIFKHFQKKLRR